MMLGAGMIITGPIFGTKLLDYDDSQSTGSIVQPSANRGSVTDGGNVVSINTGAGKFGPNCISIDANGTFLRDYIVALPGTNDWRASVGTGDFTFSCWLEPGASYSAPGNRQFFSLETSSATEFGVEVNNTLGVWLSGTRYASAVALSAGWKHYAVVRKAGKVSSWYNGARVLNQQADTYDWGLLDNITIGASAGVDRGFMDVDDLVLFTGATWDPASTTITPPTTKLGAGA